MAPSPLVGLVAFVRDSRGAAAIEFALGAAVLIAVSGLCFDFYSRIKADTAVARMAVTMADYVSRDTYPNGDEMKALGEYLKDHELGVPADLVYAVTALHQPPGDPLPAVAVLWTDSEIRFGDNASALARECPQLIDENGAAALPDGFAMSPDEVLVVAEVCATLTREGFLTGRFIAGDIYHVHALPARDPHQQPSAPVYARRDGVHALVIVAATGAPGAPWLATPIAAATPGSA